MVKVVHISEINTAELFPSREFLLGDGKGDWFVVADDELYLGRYVEKDDAESHASSLVGDAPTDEQVEAALKFAQEIEDDKS